MVSFQVLYVIDPAENSQIPLYLMGGVSVVEGDGTSEFRDTWTNENWALLATAAIEPPLGSGRVNTP